MEKVSTLLLLDFLSALLAAAGLLAILVLLIYKLKGHTVQFNSNFIAQTLNLILIGSFFA